jgi:hypothetical protein
MAGVTNEPTTRVLLTLDAGVVDEDALRALKLLAEGQDIEVTGLYVEDEDLFRAASLPGLTEINSEGMVADLDVEELGRRVSAQASLARRSLETLARTQRLKCTFHVVRGRVVDSLVSEAARSDVVVVHRSLRSTGMRTRHGSQFEPLVRAHGSLLFVNEPWRTGTSVVALCESPGAAADRALRAARRIAEAEGLELMLAVPEPVAHEAAHQDTGADRVVALRDWTERGIVDLCESAGARLLVLPSTDRLDWRALLLKLVDRVSCSLLRLD